MKKALWFVGAMLGRLSILVTIALIGYNLVAFSEIPIARAARSLWIETAMTSGKHQWLATKLFPRYVVEDVMSRMVIQDEVMSTPEQVVLEVPEVLLEVLDEDMGVDVEEVPEALPLMDVEGNKLDEKGNKIVVDDLEEGIRIVQLRTDTYVGHLMFVYDPSRVVVSTTKAKGDHGQTLPDLCKAVNGVAGINANGFANEDLNGNGGQIAGWTVSNGKEWGTGPRGKYVSAAFDLENRLIVGKMSDFSKYKIRDLTQWHPALIIDGVQQVKGSAGWGVHPRTAIGQMANGTVIMAVIDGRQPGYSIGITIGELAEILLDYGAYNATLCDGGASSVMIYKGEPVGKVCVSREIGRRLPNAWVVKSRVTEG